MISLRRVHYNTIYTLPGVSPRFTQKNLKKNDETIDLNFSSYNLKHYYNYIFSYLFLILEYISFKVFSDNNHY